MSAGGGGPRRRGDWLRTDRLVLAFALFVGGYAAWSELDYARFEAGGERVEALIERVDTDGSGYRVRHYLHYAYDYGGKTYRFDDRKDHDRLDDLYTAIPNAFVGADPPLAAGKHIGLLVDRADPVRHRPDRARLQLAWLVHLRTALALVFLGGVAAWLAWSRRAAEGASSSLGAPRSHVATSLSNGVLELRLQLDVPWPEAGRSSALDALRAKLPARPALPDVASPITTIRVAIELSPRADVILDEVHVELVSRSAAREVRTLARTKRLRAGQPERLAIELTPPADLTAVRVAVSEKPSNTFLHEHEVQAMGAT